MKNDLFENEVIFIFQNRRKMNDPKTHELVWH